MRITNPKYSIIPIVVTRPNFREASRISAPCSFGSYVFIKLFHVKLQIHRCGPQASSPCLRLSSRYLIKCLFHFLNQFARICFKKKCFTILLNELDSSKNCHGALVGISTLYCESIQIYFTVSLF